MPTFLQNLRLRRPLSKLGNQIQRVFNSALQACYAERRRLFLFFLLTYIHFEGAHDSQGHTFCPGIRWGWGGGWSRQVLFPLQFFVCFALLDFPILLPLFLREKHGFLIAHIPPSLKLLTEIVHPLAVFQIFFQSGPTYHFCCMINTTTLMA